MRQPSTRILEPIPRWLILVVSLGIVVHLSVITADALAVPSGPWPTMTGPRPGKSPQFAQIIREKAVPAYLRWIHMDSGERRPGSQVATPGVYLDIRLKDHAGNTMSTCRFPDPNAGAWLRNRQLAFVRELVNDEPVQPLAGEAVPAPGQHVRRVLIWDITGERSLKLQETPEHLVPRDRPVFRPSDWSLILVRSYARFLCREYAASSAEVIRHTREPIPPDALFVHDPRALVSGFEDLVANYGDLPGE